MEEGIILKSTPYYFYGADGLVFMAGEMNPGDAAEAARLNSCSYAEGRARPGWDYVAEGVLLPRPEMPIQVDGLTLRNVPFPSELSVDRRSFYQVDDSIVELEFDRPGTYLVGVRCPPYLDWGETFENQARN